MTESAHSALGASSAYRWMACPGSVRESVGMPNESSEFAMEGTAAHFLASTCLHGLNKAAQTAGEFTGRSIVVLRRGGELWGDDEHGSQVDIGLGASEVAGVFEVTDEMAEAVQVYLDADAMDADPDDEVLTEHRFAIPQVHEAFFGTNDRCRWKPAERTLIVTDYKHGRGVPVEVVENKQLIYYAIGALMTNPQWKPTTVRLQIVQPRCPHPDGPVRCWEITVANLLDYCGDLKLAAMATEAPDAPLVAGDHCKFCPAAPKCPELREQSLRAAEIEFGANSGEPVCREPDTFPPEQLAKVLDQAGMIEDWIRRVREYAHHEAEAGRCPPGYKLVAKRATRKWKDEQDTLDTLRTAYGVEDEHAFKAPEMLSPAQMETQLRKHYGLKGKKATEALLPLYESVSSGAVLAPVADPREPVKPEADQDFA